MNILITHGYLLNGTGSNLYVNNLVREWCKIGHNVFLVCQEPHADGIDFINELYHGVDDNKSVELKHSKNSEFDGKCFCFIPDISGLLPVYVYDHYDGFTVKEFPDCSDQELTNYVDLNTNMLSFILDNYDIDKVQTNHTVMFPFIASKAISERNISHYATVHGSALNFTVKKFDRFVPYAIKGLESATKLLVDSKHAEEELHEFLTDQNRTDLIERIVIIPAGVDINNFNIENNKSTQLTKFINSLAPLCEKSKGRTETINEKVNELRFSNPNYHSLIKSIRDSYDYRNIDVTAASRIDSIKIDQNPTVLFIGKYLWTKGIHLIIGAIPYILKQKPDTQFIFVGFGPFREIAETIINSIENKEIELLIEELKNNPDLFTGEKEELPILLDFLNEHKSEFSNISSGLNIKDRITFTGIISHKELVHLIPAVDVLIAPSVFPEAFGMVAIEAMACGVYPVLSYQSAFMEITDELIECIKDYPVAIEKVSLDKNAPIRIANNVLNYFNAKSNFDTNQFTRFQNDMRQLVVDKYSWKGIAESYISNYKK